jgi:DNA polymerase-4
VADRLTILHVDMDAFFAAVEQRDRPELRGRPVIVGGGPAGRAVVCAASYEARPFGVHSAMPVAQAARLCPQAAVLPLRIDHYRAVAREVRDVLLAFTPVVEPLSLDEAFLDVRGCEGLFGPAPRIAGQVKARVKAETGLTASVGVASNKFLAKLASDLGKPDGLVVVEPQTAAAFLAPLPVGRVWGVGAKGERRLQALGVRTVGELAALPGQVLIDHFGESGRQLHELAHGRDPRPVVPDRLAKSVSTETTFATDIGDRAVLRGWLLSLAEELGERLRRLGARARTVELKVRSADFQTRSRSQTLADPSDLTESLWRATAGLFDERVPDAWLPVRLLGVAVSGLVRGELVQGDLFEGAWRGKQQALDRVQDAIRQKFGADAIRRAGGASGDGPPPPA